MRELAEICTQVSARRSAQASISSRRGTLWQTRLNVPSDFLRGKSVSKGSGGSDVGGGWELTYLGWWEPGALDLGCNPFLRTVTVGCWTIKRCKAGSNDPGKLGSRKVEGGVEDENSRRSVDGWAWACTQNPFRDTILPLPAALRSNMQLPQILITLPTSSSLYNSRLEYSIQRSNAKLRSFLFQCLEDIIFRVFNEQLSEKSSKHSQKYHVFSKTSLCTTVSFHIPINVHFSLIILQWCLSPYYSKRRLVI